jgi:hypothetical protein
MKTRISI